MSCLRRELAIQRCDGAGVVSQTFQCPQPSKPLALLGRWVRQRKGSDCAAFYGEGTDVNCKAQYVLVLRSQQILLRSESAPLKTRLRYALQIAEGMKYFSDNGFIHRDLKPANILVRCYESLVAY